MTGEVVLTGMKTGLLMSMLTTGTGGDSGDGENKKGLPRERPGVASTEMGRVRPPLQHNPRHTRNYWTGFRPLALIPPHEPTAMWQRCLTVSEIFRESPQMATQTKSGQCNILSVNRRCELKRREGRKGRSTALPQSRDP